MLVLALCLVLTCLHALAAALLHAVPDSRCVVCSDILRMDNMSADAMYVRGLSLYYQDNMEKAFQHFQQVLRLAPDHNKAKDVYRVSNHTVTDIVILCYYILFSVL